MIYIKWSNFIGCYAWQRMVIGREKSRHCQTWLERRSSLNENVQRKQNWTAKSTNLEENAWKNQVSFCHRSSPVSRKAWTLPWRLQELKEYPCGCGQPRCHLIRVLNESAVNDCGDFFVFCGWWSSNQFDIVLETHFSCDTVDRGL